MIFSTRRSENSSRTRRSSNSCDVGSLFNKTEVEFHCFESGLDPDSSGSGSRRTKITHKRSGNSSRTRRSLTSCDVGSLFNKTEVEFHCFGSGLGSGCMRIRIQEGKNNPLKKRELLENKEVIDFLRRRKLVQQDWGWISLFRTFKPDQDTDPNPHWFSSLDPDLAPCEPWRVNEIFQQNPCLCG